jgi:uncharacterized repeat protein (TIGR01451 family)
MLVAAFISTALADDDEKGHIMLKNIAQMEKVVINDKGEQEAVRVPAATVVPGDEVIYTISYENISDHVAESVVITDPVPENTFYVADSAKGEGTDITFSIDNGITYDKPEKLVMVLNDGTSVKAEPSEYSNIRWTIMNDLQPGESGDVSFRVEIK